MNCVVAGCMIMAFVVLEWCVFLVPKHLPNPKQSRLASKTKQGFAVWLVEVPGMADNRPGVVFLQRF